MEPPASGPLFLYLKLDSKYTIFFCPLDNYQVRI
jgi:hypothetical protein